MSSTTARNAVASASSGVMSRKRIPGFGKSGISLMCALRSIIVQAPPSWSERLPNRGRCEQHQPMLASTPVPARWLGPGHLLYRRQEEQWIAGNVVFAHLEVQVGAGGMTAVADGADDVAAPHVLPLV